MRLRVARANSRRGGVGLLLDTEAFLDVVEVGKVVLLRVHGVLDRDNVLSLERLFSQQVMPVLPLVQFAVV